MLRELRDIDDLHESELDAILGRTRAGDSYEATARDFDVSPLAVRCVVAEAARDDWQAMHATAVTERDIALVSLAALTPHSTTLNEAVESTNEGDA